MNTQLQESLSASLSLPISIYFDKLYVVFTFHVDRGLLAHTPRREHSGQSIEVVAGSTWHGNTWPLRPAHGTGVAWRGIGTGPHEMVAKTTGVGHTLSAVFEANGIDVYVAKTFFWLLHSTRPVCVFPEALRWRSGVETPCNPIVVSPFRRMGAPYPGNLALPVNAPGAVGGNCT